ncbi:uncharacterized protein [Palaemon carinicauda]|uniref:uncharacterized protein n=1 Tax=Palaemon carinicauda TaxID=392227 RepID=UPI0035B62A57
MFSFSQFTTLGERLFSKKISPGEGKPRVRDDDKSQIRTGTLQISEAKYRNESSSCDAGHPHSEGCGDVETSKCDKYGTNDVNNEQLSSASVLPDFSRSVSPHIRGSVVPHENDAVIQQEDLAISSSPSSVGPGSRRSLLFLDIKPVDTMPGNRVLSTDNSPSEEFYDAQDGIPSQEPLAVVASGVEREEDGACNIGNDNRTETQNLLSVLDDGGDEEFQDALDNDLHLIPLVSLEVEQHSCVRQEEEVYQSVEQTSNQEKSSDLNAFSFDIDGSSENNWDTGAIDISTLTETRVSDVLETSTDTSELNIGTLTEINDIDRLEGNVSTKPESNEINGKLEVIHRKSDKSELNESAIVESNRIDTSIGSRDRLVYRRGSEGSKVNLDNLIYTNNSDKLYESTNGINSNDKNTIRVNYDTATERNETPVLEKFSFDRMENNTSEIEQIKLKTGTHNGCHKFPDDIFYSELEIGNKSDTSTKILHLDILETLGADSITKKPPIGPTQPKNSNRDYQKPSRILAEFRPLQKSFENSRLKEETRQIVMMLENDKACKVPRPNLGLQDRLKSLMQNSVGKKPRSYIKGPRFCGTYVKSVAKFANEVIEGRRDSFREFIQQRRGFQGEKSGQNHPSSLSDLRYNQKKDSLTDSVLSNVKDVVSVICKQNESNSTLQSESFGINMNHVGNETFDSDKQLDTFELKTGIGLTTDLILTSSSIPKEERADNIGKNAKDINEHIHVKVTNHTERVNDLDDRVADIEINREMKSSSEGLVILNEVSSCERDGHSSLHQTYENNFTLKTSIESTDPVCCYGDNSKCTEFENNIGVQADELNSICDQNTNVSDIILDQSAPYVDDVSLFKLQNCDQTILAPDQYEKRTNDTDFHNNINDDTLFDRCSPSNNKECDITTTSFVSGVNPPSVSDLPYLNDSNSSKKCSESSEFFKNQTTGTPCKENHASSSKINSEVEFFSENRKRKAKKLLSQQQPSKKSLTSSDLQKHIASLNKVSKELVSKQTNKEKEISLQLSDRFTNKDSNIKNRSSHIQKEAGNTLEALSTSIKDFEDGPSLHLHTIENTVTDINKSIMVTGMAVDQQNLECSNSKGHPKCNLSLSSLDENKANDLSSTAKPIKESATHLSVIRKDNFTCTEIERMKMSHEMQEREVNTKRTIIETDISRLKMDNLVARHRGAHFIYKKVNDSKRETVERSVLESRSVPEVAKQDEEHKRESTIANFENVNDCHRSSVERLQEIYQNDEKMKVEDKNADQDHRHVRSRYSSVGHRGLCQSKSRRNTVAKRRFSCFPDGKNSRQSSQLLLNKATSKGSTNFSQTTLKKCLEIVIDRCESLGWEVAEDTPDSPSEISSSLSLEELNKELIQAVTRHNAGKVRELLKLGADPNISCGHSPALVRAAKDGMLYIVQALVAAGAEIDARIASGDSAVHVAARGGHSEVIIDLIHSGAHVDAINRNGVTPLQTALAYGHLEVAQELLRMHADILAANKVGETALEIANNLGYVGLTGKPRELRRDSAPGTRVEVPPSEIPVAVKMIQGIEEGCAATVEECLNLGANANTLVPLALHWPARAGVLHRACHHGEDLIARLLLAAGANINMRDHVGNTPLHAAAQAGHNKVVKVLLACGAKLESISQSGMTPLHRAASKGKDLTCHLLMRRGASPKVEDNSGRTPADWARKRGFKSLAKKLFYRRRSSSTLFVDANHKHQLQHLNRLHQVALKAGQRSDSMECEE